MKINIRLRRKWKESDAPWGSVVCIPPAPPTDILKTSAALPSHAPDAWTPQVLELPRHQVFAATQTPSCLCLAARRSVHTCALLLSRTRAFPCHLVLGGCLGHGVPMLRVKHCKSHSFSWDPGTGWLPCPEGLFSCWMPCQTFRVS